jgi:hypothetical protein
VCEITETNVLRHGEPARPPRKTFPTDPQALHKSGNISHFKKGGEECGNGSRTPCRKAVVMMIIRRISSQVDPIDGATSVKSWTMCTYGSERERRMTRVHAQPRILSSTLFFSSHRIQLHGAFMVHLAPQTSSKGTTLTEVVMTSTRLHLRPSEEKPGGTGGRGRESWDMCKLAVS